MGLTDCTGAAALQFKGSRAFWARSGLACTTLPQVHSYGEFHFDVNAPSVHAQNLTLSLTACTMWC